MYCWIVHKLKNGDFNVEYPDNTQDGAPIEKDSWIDDLKFFNSIPLTVSEGFAFTDKTLSSAPTTTKVRPMDHQEEEDDDIVDILDFISLRIHLTNKQIVRLIEILDEK